MPIKTSIDKMSGIIIHKVTGSTSLEEFQNSFERLVSDPDFRQSMPVLWDFRHLEAGNIRKDGIEKVTQFYAAQKERRGTGFKTAIVAKKDVVYGISRMIEVYASSVLTEIEIFRCHKKALEWLRC